MSIFSSKKNFQKIFVLFFLFSLICLPMHALAEGPAGLIENAQKNYAAALEKANAPGATAEDKQAVETAKKLLDDAETLKPNAAIGNALGTGAEYVASGVMAAAEASLIAVSSFILVFANMIVGIAGVLFNWVIVKTVFQFSTIIGNSPGLLLAWGILRDIGNMILLFGFIFMGLGVILDLHSFPAKKALPQLIIFAILMNFSLFAAEAVIDTSNVFSTVMYNQANTSTCASLVNQGGGTAQSNLDCAVNYGIAGHIMQSTGLSSIFAGDVTSGKQGSVLLGLALFATIAAVVLFAGAIMLIIRAVLLTFLMVTAPIGFAGMAVPFLHGVAKKWWHTLIGEAFFAPVFLLLIFISLKITDGLSVASDGNNLAAALTHNDTSVMGVYLIFFVVIGFLVSSLIMAKKMGAMGAGFATNAATKVAFGGVALGTNLGLNGLGRGGRYLQQKYAPDSKIGKFATKRILTPLEGANFDMRRVPGVGSLLKEAGAGDGAKASTTGLTLGGVEHLAHEYHDSEETKERNYQNQVGKAALDNFEKDKAAANNAALTPAERGAAQQRVNKSEQFLAGLSVKELEQLKQIKEGNAAIVAALSPEKFAALMKSDKITDSQKTGIQTARFGGLASDMQIIRNPASSVAEKEAAKTRIQQFSTKELQHAPVNLLGSAEVLDSFSGAQRENLLKEDGITMSIKDQIRQRDPIEKIRAAFAAGNNTASPALGVDVSRLNPKQVAKLSGDILGSSNVAGRLTTQMLNEINTTNEISDAARNNIKRVLAARAASDPRIAAYLASPAGQFNWT